eukprot:g2431.t1
MCSLRTLLFVLSFVIFAQFAIAQHSGKTAYLAELTIYRTRETRLVFRNRPEVYLQCHDDGLPDFQLRRVNRINQRYVFKKGDRAYTTFGPSRCVTCRLQEEDFLKEDDTFGSWVMCEEHFQLTGNHTVFVNSQFTATFVCPDCKIEDIEPSIPPEELTIDDVEPSVLSDELILDDDDEPSIPPVEPPVEEPEVLAMGSEIETEEHYYLMIEKDTFDD